MVFTNKILGVKRKLISEHPNKGITLIGDDQQEASKKSESTKRFIASQFDKMIRHIFFILYFLRLKGFLFVNQRKNLVFVTISFRYRSPLPHTLL